MTMSTRHGGRYRVIGGLESWLRLPRWITGWMHRQVRCSPCVTSGSSFGEKRLPVIQSTCTSHVPDFR